MLPLPVYYAVLFSPNLKSLSYENSFKMYYVIQLGPLNFIINDIVSRNELLWCNTISVNVFVLIKMLLWWRIQ